MRAITINETYHEVVELLVEALSSEQIRELILKLFFIVIGFWVILFAVRTFIKVISGDAIFGGFSSDLKDASMTTPKIEKHKDKVAFHESINLQGDPVSPVKSSLPSAPISLQKQAHNIHLESAKIMEPSVETLEVLQESADFQTDAWAYPMEDDWSKRMEADMEASEVQFHMQLEGKR